MATLWTPTGEVPFELSNGDRIQMDWQEYDWRVYNPSDDSRFMNYSEYRRRRQLPEGDKDYLPPPDPQKVLAEIQHPHLEGAGW